ncbi:hypothetical protein FXO38_24674 [Capsicum annuum]|nr:hypothetical protein FXO38_24674 [Capsicum annuum]
MEEMEMIKEMKKRRRLVKRRVKPIIVWLKLPRIALAARQGSSYTSWMAVVIVKKGSLLMLQRKEAPHCGDENGIFPESLSDKDRRAQGYSVAYKNAHQGDDTNPRHGVSAGDGVANDTKVKRIKLKVGGATCIIQTKNSSDGSSKSAQSSDSSRPRQNLTPQVCSKLKDNPSEDAPLADKKSGSNTFGVETKSEVGRTKQQQALLTGKEVKKISSQGSEHTDNEKKEILSNVEVKQMKKKDKQMKESSETPVETKSEVGHTKRQRALPSGKEVKRTSSQVSTYTDHEKKELLSDGEAKRSKKKESTETPVETKSEVALTKRQRALLSSKEAKRISSQDSEYSDYEKKELLSDGEVSRSKKKEKQLKESSETPVETKREIGLTTRQRALLLKRDSSTSSVDLIEFPSGLPPAPPQKQKHKLSEVELQLKRAKANQKRRMQHEKAAWESEAEAIRKILGQDSSRKKREEKLKTEQEELAQKAAKELPPNTIRTVIGPSGTTVTISHDIGLPSIFDSKPCNYPPPREKCSGPSCENTYKYRDSKT